MVGHRPRGEEDAGNIQQHWRALSRNWEPSQEDSMSTEKPLPLGMGLVTALGA
jgi:hypothetical protein